MAETGTTAPTGKAFREVVRKIPFFVGLTSLQMQELLNLCTSRQLEAGDVLCEVGDAADEMFILVSGALEVTTAKDVQLATITPVTTVGEMGMLTGEPRSATVRALEPSRLLGINRRRFAGIRQTDPELVLHIQQNIIAILSARLRLENERRGSTEEDDDGAWIPGLT